MGQAHGNKLANSLVTEVGRVPAWGLELEVEWELYGVASSPELNMSSSVLASGTSPGESPPKGLQQETFSP